MNKAKSLHSSQDLRTQMGHLTYQTRDNGTCLHPMSFPFGECLTQIMETAQPDAVFRLGAKVEAMAYDEQIRQFCPRY